MDSGRCGFTTKNPVWPGVMSWLRYEVKCCVGSGWAVVLSCPSFLWQRVCKPPNITHGVSRSWLDRVYTNFFRTEANPAAGCADDAHGCMVCWLAGMLGDGAVYVGQSACCAPGQGWGLVRGRGVLGVCAVRVGV